MLCRAVSAESGGETLECQIAVTETILNRVDSTRFPNTIRDVIYAPGQFQIVDNGSIDIKKPSAKTIEAVNTALSSRHIPDNVLYFNSIGFFSWVIPYEKIDHMYFSSVGNNQIKTQVCINEITFCGNKENIKNLNELLNKRFSSNSKYGETWYGNYANDIGIKTDTNGYIDNISSIDVMDGQYYFSILSYTDNDVQENFLNDLSEYFNVDYYYMSTNPTSRENYIKDETHKFYKYSYLLIVNTENYITSKYLKSEVNVIDYVNDKFAQNFTTYNEAKNYIENISKDNGASVIYEYQNL